MTASEVFGETSVAKSSTFGSDRLLIVSSDPLGPTPPPSPIPDETAVAATKKTKKALSGEDRSAAAITWSPEIIQVTDVGEDDDEKKIDGECRLHSNSGGDGER